ncbi:ribonuclease HI [Thermodesulfitimonas autotrophica]|uniref:Ribonuclease HI n=1 Tax=Thermodesulfitimonas autotrophica TaxID=1894989 RepID=A0A3N5ABJ4_9THEO|nr:ribonuclease HI [Thermodesulfitimonas autotrophica]RPF41987.1 ribonuclease HI [Thermodesulfitimonas autotrophica]
MVIVFCDGLCEPNPGGVATYGWLAYRDCAEIMRERVMARYGVVCSGPGATSNVAEYTAVIRALEWLIKNGYAGEEIEVRSDSQLVVRQLTGQYAVNAPLLMPLYRKARELASRFASVRFRWVPREENETADTLSRRAYYRYTGREAIKRV